MTFECPTLSEITLIGTFEFISNVTWECLRSWNLIWSKSLSLRNLLNFLLNTSWAIGFSFLSKNNKFKLKGQTLHAKKLGFIHPTTKEYVEFDSELPKYFQDILNKLK